jgi:hypothetical protein
MLFGISDVNTVPWIYNNSKRTGGWWLVLGIFIGILIYELIILLSNVLPHKIKHKFARTLSPKHRNDEQNSTANG